MLESENGDRRTEEANAEKGMSHLSGFGVWLSDAAGAGARVQCPCLPCQVATCLPHRADFVHDAAKGFSRRNRHET